MYIPYGFRNHNDACLIFAVCHSLANVPHSVRTYPGSAANAMLPLTPANNWTATVCSFYNPGLLGYGVVSL